MNTLKWTFYIKKDKQNVDGIAPIYLKITANGTEATISIGFSSNVARWKSTKSLKLSQLPEEIAIRDELNDIRKKMNKLNPICNENGIVLNAKLAKEVKF